MRIIQSAGMESVLPNDQVYPATDIPFEGFDACLCHVARDHDAIAEHLPNWQKYLEASRSVESDTAPNG